VKTPTLALLIALSVPAAYADTPTIAVAQALENNLEIASARAGMEASSFDKSISATEFFPDLTASANTTWNESTTEQSPGPDIKNSYNEHGYRLTLSQTLFDLGRLFRFTQARKDYSIEQLKFESTRQKVISNTFSHYIEVLKLYARQKTTRLELASAQARLHQITRNVDAGNTARSSLYEAEAKTNSVQTALIDIDKKIHIALNKLAKESGYRAHPSYDIDPAMPIEPIGAVAQSILEDQLREQNLDILIAKQSLERSKSSLNEKRSKFSPTISADINYAFSDTNDAAAKTPPATGDSDSTSYRLSLTLPLFNGGERFYEIGKVKSLTNKSQIDLDNALQDAHITLQELVLNVNADARSVEMLKSNIIANHKSYAGQKKAYELGTRTLSDVLSAEKLLYDSLRTYFDTLYDYLKNVIEMKSTLGALALSDIDQISRVMRMQDPRTNERDLDTVLDAIRKGGNT